jgi:hypothetical protein
MNDDEEKLKQFFGLLRYFNDNRNLPFEDEF